MRENFPVMIGPSPAMTGLSGMSGMAGSAPPATHYSVVGSSPQTAGTAFNVVVTALTAANATATGYAGTATFTSTDGSATLPADHTLTSGKGTFSVTLNTEGTFTVTAADTVHAGITGTSGSIVVNGGTPDHFTVVIASPKTAGASCSVVVTCLDSADYIANLYAGSINWTSTDGAATLPSNGVTLTNGVGTFTAAFKTAGPQTITATDVDFGTPVGTSNTVTVNPGATTHYSANADSPQTAGASFNFVVTALDAFGNTATDYTGTVAFTSTDSSPTLPMDGTLTSGAGTFSATLTTAQSDTTITATDNMDGGITGSTSNINVVPGATTHYLLNANGDQTSGQSFNVSVTSYDVFGNNTTGYTGTATFTSTDNAAVLPSDGTLTNGQGAFSVTLITPGTQTVTATDINDAGITGTSNDITVGM